jgi:putative protein-disulfide isomerase
MGGLRPYNRERATPAFRDTIKSHWAAVAQESGLTFNDAALMRDGFVCDTEPACRAVVTARTLDARGAHAYFRHVQRAFYGEGRDVTDAAVLADLGAEIGFDRNAFHAHFDSSQARNDTRLDFSTAHQMGVRGFPTLVAGYPGNRFYVIANGYLRAGALAERMTRVDEVASRADAAPGAESVHALPVGSMEA